MPTAGQGLLGGLGQDAFGGQGQDQQRPQMGMYSRTTTTTQNPGQSIQSPAQPSVTTPQSPLTAGAADMSSPQSGMGMAQSLQSIMARALQTGQMNPDQANQLNRGGMGVGV